MCPCIFLNEASSFLFSFDYDTASVFCRAKGMPRIDEIRFIIFGTWGILIYIRFWFTATNSWQSSIWISSIQKTHIRTHKHSKPLQAWTVGIDLPSSSQCLDTRHVSEQKRCSQHLYIWFKRSVFRNSGNTPKRHRKCWIQVESLRYFFRYYYSWAFHDKWSAQNRRLCTTN